MKNKGQTDKNKRKVLTKMKNGYKNIENIVYKNMLHEVLNETGKEKVYTDLLNFINK